MARRRDDRYRDQGVMRRRWYAGKSFASAADAVTRTLHVSFCRCRARIEILEDQMLCHIRTTREEPPSNSFQQSGYFGTAQGLMCKFDGIDPCAYRMGKRSHMFM
jgi:hypothetical protein